ncbi:hypothetical protein TNCT_611411 [Trichonephila clavata]|uniref:Uncharacterized protein n=1 Tax=Trichonephila clavata TaxID=2740835 RepID=A0A8X6FUQ7_TRICU|nr:hypothetical protein TNCT_611411 [Trichonephila clavata]
MRHCHPSLLEDPLVPSLCHKLSFREMNPEFLVAALLLRLYGCLLDSIQGLEVDDSSIMTHTQSPNARIRAPLLLAARKRGSYQSKGSKHTTPGMDPQSGLWNCAISALVQRSSEDYSWVANLYLEIRLKANTSFRSRDGASRGDDFSK